MACWEVILDELEERSETCAFFVADGDGACTVMGRALTPSGSEVVAVRAVTDVLVMPVGRSSDSTSLLSSVVWDCSSRSLFF